MSYFILGHGSENIENERKEMPEDTILVTASECGKATIYSEVFELINELYKNPELAKTPEAFPESIRKRLRIYYPGMEYPTVSVSPLLDFTYMSDGKKVISLEKAGVYPIPLPFSPEEFYVGNINVKIKPFSGKYVNNKDGIIDKVYKDSLISPPLEEIKKTYGDDLPFMTLGYPIPIDEIFSTLGKGIYYFPICRNLEILNIDIRDLYNQLPKSMEKLNSVELAKHMLNYTSNENVKKKLKRQIFTVRNVIRPRSAEKQRLRGPKTNSGGSRKRRYTRKRTQKN